MKRLLAVYTIIVVLFVFFSYGFVDFRLTLTSFAPFDTVQKIWRDFIYHHSYVAGVAYGVFIGIFFGFYLWILWVSKQKKVLFSDMRTLILVISSILIFSFPAFSYDIFNYILTVKMTYTYHENPYIVMPTEIVNEPMLAYTRAANKVALYGPVWILLTFIPYAAGFFTVWPTLLLFKLFSLLWYGCMLYLIFRITKDIRNVIFWGLHPLVLIEVLVSAHNDTPMMVLAMVALLILKKQHILAPLGFAVVMLLSVFTKGSTVVLAPLYFFRKHSLEDLFTKAFWLMLGVFLLTPIREEMYPWYAVWFLSFAAVLPIERHIFIHWFSIVACMGLVFRHLPYIVTHEYGGTGPGMRFLFTVIPVILYCAWYIWHAILSQYKQKT